MSRAYVAGVGMTTFGKNRCGLRSLVESATRDALTDAGVSAKEVGHVYFGNATAGLLQGQEMIRGQVYLRDTGLLGATMVNVENACSSSSTAFFLAVNAIVAGAADIALAVGGEEMIMEERSRAFGALASAADTERHPEMRAMVQQLSLGQPARLVMPTASPLMAHYARKGREYLENSGAQVEDFARVVAKSRAWGSENKRAQFRRAISLEEVMASRMIVAPLRLPMCAPLSNGAAAVVVVSEAIAHRLGTDRIRVRAVIVLSNDPGSELSPTRVSAARAFEVAGLDPSNIDVTEVHDAAASAELIIMEELGLAEEGKAFDLLRSGRTGPGGDVPVNSSGGLLSRGHPIGATGCAQIVELVEQLRGASGNRQVEGARLAMAQNGGGVLDGDEATVSVSILERIR